MTNPRIEKLVGETLKIAAESWGIEKVDNETDVSLRCRIYAAMVGKPIPDPKVRIAKPARWWLTFLWTWQADIFAFVAILFIRAAWGKSIFWSDGLWAELKAGSWPMRTWYREWGGTTFCHGGMLANGRCDVLPHELHHVEQTEGRMLAGLVLGLASMVAVLLFGCGPKAALVALEIPWFGSWFVGYVASLAQAYLRGEDPYFGSYLEEAAYSLADDDKKTCDD